MLLASAHLLSALIPTWQKFTPVLEFVALAVLSEMPLLTATLQRCHVGLAPCPAVTFCVAVVSQHVCSVS